MKKVVFIIGSVDISGGTYVILQHALYLEAKGIDVSIASCIEFDKYQHFKNTNNFWHPALKSLKVLHVDAIVENFYDVAIFTWWRTVYYLPQIQAAKSVYFVQSIESRFYNSKDLPLIKLVDKTYTFGLPVITEASWIKTYLKNNYNQLALLARNGIRKDLYTPIGKLISPKTSKLRILVEGPLQVAFKNTEKALKLATKIRGVECWLLTSSEISHYKGVDRVFSRIPVEQVAEIYRSCDVILKLSYVEGMFGPPLEMFHCGGTCVVYNVTGHEEYIINDYNGIVIQTDDEKAVINALNRLKNCPIYLQNLKLGALTTANKWIDWNESSSTFMHCLQEIFANNNENRQALQVAVKEAFSQYEYEVRQKKSYLKRILDKIKE